MEVSKPPTIMHFATFANCIGAFTKKQKLPPRSKAGFYLPGHFMATWRGKGEGLDGQQDRTTKSCIDLAWATAKRGQNLEQPRRGGDGMTGLALGKTA